MKINSFNIDVSNMPEARTNKSFVVNGEVGAEFEIIAIQNPSSASDHTLYYDWQSKSFEAGHNDTNNNLRIKLVSKIYNNNISFAAGAAGGGSYVIKLIAINGTKLSNPRLNTITKNLTKQAADTVVTLAPLSLANSSSYATLPSSTLTSSVGSSGTINFNFKALNTASDAEGFGLTFPRFTSGTVFTDSRLLVFTTTDTVDGAITDGNQVVVDSLTDIGVGMSIIAVSAGSLAGAPFVTAIDTSTKALTISVPQTFSDGITLTFKAVGTEPIQAATGLLLGDISYTISLPTETKQLVRVAPSASTTILMKDTYGISGGSVISYKGTGVNNATTNKVVAVTTADVGGGGGDGVITVELAQTLAVSTELTFKGIFQQLKLIGSIKIDKFPSSNKTINIDLDSISVPGVAS